MKTLIVAGQVGQLPVVLYINKVYIVIFIYDLIKCFFYPSCQISAAQIPSQPVWAERGSSDQAQNLHEHGVQPTVWEEVPAVPLLNFVFKKKKKKSFLR